MSFFDPNKWRAWAAQWGLTHHPAKFGKREWMSGAYKGYLVRMGWDDQRGTEFYALVRYQRVPTPAVIRQRLAEDPSLEKLPGFKRMKPEAGVRDLIPAVSGQPWRVLNLETPAGSGLKVGESAMVWRIMTSGWGRPSAKKLAEWLEALITALGPIARPLEERCEQCNTTTGARHVLLDGVPARLCGGCRQQLVQQGQMAAQTYESLDANYLMGVAYATAVAVVGSALWAVLAVITNRMWVLCALIMAFGIAIAYRVGAKKIDLFGRVVGVVLTLGSVVLGDVLFLAWEVMQKRPDIGFKLQAGWYVFVQLLTHDPRDILLSAFFGLIGAFYTFKLLTKPKFVPTIEEESDTRAVAA